MGWSRNDPKTPKNPKNRLPPLKMALLAKTPNSFMQGVQKSKKLVESTKQPYEKTTVPNVKKWT
jgi:hypothetical protein